MDSLNSLNDLVYGKKCTLLGIGPMSKNCIDVVIELANKLKGISNVELAQLTTISI